MIDPRHGRRIPSGRRFARALARVFRSLWDQSRATIEAGAVPDSLRMREAVYRLAMNALGVELAAGYVATFKRANHDGIGMLRRRVRKQFRVGGNAAILDRARKTVQGLSSETDDRSASRGLLRVLEKTPGGQGAPTQGKEIQKALRFDEGTYLPQSSPARIPPMKLPPIATVVAELPEGLVFDWTLFRPEVRVEAERLALRLAGTIVEDTRRMIREELSAGLQAGEPVAAMAERIRLQAFSPRRAATIAQTEASRAVHAGQGIAAKELGVTEWTWLASSDACDICLALDGKTVRIGEPFYVHPKGNPAYRVVYHPPGHPNCYCTATEEMPV